MKRAPKVVGIPERESGVRPRFDPDAAPASRGSDLAAELSGSVLDGSDWRSALASMIDVLALRLDVACPAEVAWDDVVHACVDGIDEPTALSVLGPVLAAARDGAAAVATTTGDGEAMRAARRLGVSSVACVPMCGRSGVIGALAIIGPCAVSLDGMVRLSRRMALAVEHARSYDDALARASRSQQLLATVAHDIKNPLGVVMLSAARVLAEPEAGDAGRTQHIDTILRATRRMGKLVGDLLDATAIENGALSMRATPCDIGVLVAEALHEIEPLAQAPGIRLANEVPRGLPRVACDPDRIHQVLSNLLGNALKFTPHGGLVAVRAQRQGETIATAVSDSGVGIARRHLPRLFDRFWRAPGSAAEGSGLGLAICKSIVELGGGTIDVASALGVGTTVTFTLPIA